MSKKEHGTTSSPVQNSLRYGVSFDIFYFMVISCKSYRHKQTNMQSNIIISCMSFRLIKS